MACHYREAQRCYIPNNVDEMPRATSCLSDEPTVNCADQGSNRSTKVLTLQRFSLGDHFVSQNDDFTRG